MYFVFGKFFSENNGNSSAQKNSHSPSKFTRKEFSEFTGSLLRELKSRTPLFATGELGKLNLWQNEIPLTNIEMKIILIPITNTGTHSNYYSDSFKLKLI